MRAAAVAAAAVSSPSIAFAAARRAASTLVVAEVAGSKLPNLTALVAAARALGPAPVEVLLAGGSDAALAGAAAQASQARGAHRAQWRAKRRCARQLL
jgi:hypothetical protein